LNAQDETRVLEWISYDRFEGIECINGNVSIKKAIWLDGPIRTWSYDKKNWIRYGKKNVVLKDLSFNKV